MRFLCVAAYSFASADPAAVGRRGRGKAFRGTGQRTAADHSDGGDADSLCGRQPDGADQLYRTAGAPRCAAFDQKQPDRHDAVKRTFGRRAADRGGYPRAKRRCDRTAGQHLHQPFGGALFDYVDRPGKETAMSKRLDGTSMFTGINSGLTNAFSQLNSQYTDGVTLENLNKALSNSNFINNAGMNATFASYMTNNFNSIDSNTDGKISADEIQKLMSNMATQGLTREQIMSLAGSSGLSTSLQETVLNHFDQIDKNKDGKVTNQEIQTFGIESDLEKQKAADRNRLVSNMSMFYEVGNVDDSSLLDYRYLDNDKS